VTALRNVDVAYLDTAHYGRAMQNLSNILVCALLTAIIGCSKYSDFPPPPDGAPCMHASDCGPNGACWQWSCVSDSCLAVVSPDFDNAGQPATCDMSIDGSPGTCHAGQCDPDNGTTEQCYPTSPPDCYPPMPDAIVDHDAPIKADACAGRGEGWTCKRGACEGVCLSGVCTCL
jgi:hypothetical protein